MVRSADWAKAPLPHARTAIAAVAATTNARFAHFERIASSSVAFWIGSSRFRGVFF